MAATEAGKVTRLKFAIGEAEYELDAVATDMSIQPSGVIYGSFFGNDPVSYNLDEAGYNVEVTFRGTSEVVRRLIEDNPGISRTEIITKLHEIIELLERSKVLVICDSCDTVNVFPYINNCTSCGAGLGGSLK